MQLGLDLEPQDTAPVFATDRAFSEALEQYQAECAGAQGPLRAAPIETPLGTMVAVCGAAHLHLLEFATRPELPREIAKLASAQGAIAAGETPITQAVRDQLSGYFGGTRAEFSLPISQAGSEFAQGVWAALQQIPAGETRSYGAMARHLGQPTATRAVARANGANQIAIIVPCHRVIGADGTLTGYAGGLWRKRALLDLEAGYAP